MSGSRPETSGVPTSRATVMIGKRPSMAANIRLSGPGALSMSFPLGAEAGDSRLVGDVATVTADSGSCVQVEIRSVAVMGYIEVCEASILQHVSGPPIERRQERRESKRCRFSEPVTVNVTPDGSTTSTVGELGDVSAGGCGLQLVRPTYRKIGAMIEAVLRFELAGIDQPVVLKARRRNTRALRTDTILMGMIWCREPDEADDLKRLSEYLNTRAGPRLSVRSITSSRHQEPTRFGEPFRIA